MSLHYHRTSVIWTSSFFMFVLSFFNIKDLAITRKCIIFALVNCLLTKKKIKYMADTRITQLRMLQNSFFGNSTKGCSTEVYNKINDLIEKYKNEK